MSKILIVDDDLELTGLLQELLELEGFKVVIAHDGVRALEMLDSSIDLLLLDPAAFLFAPRVTVSAVTDDK